jgi:hypothetical protein
LFRNPRDPRFRRLWNEYQFRDLRRTQQANRREREPAADDEPVLLPFVRPERDERPPQVRHDGPATVAPPHKPRTPRRADKRNVK